MTPRMPLLILGVSALGACATMTASPKTLPLTASAADQHRIEVEQTAERMEIAIAPDDMALTSKSLGDIDTFASGYLRYGHGALILSAPEGGANANAAARLTDQARLALQEAGVSYAAIAGSSYDASGEASAPIIMSYTRFEAIAPECAPLWQQDLAHQLNNQAWESFGCATQSNIAALLEDPADLLAPRTEDPRDAARRDAVFGHYRNGEITHAARDNDERISISNAVQ